MKFLKLRAKLVEKGFKLQDMHKILNISASQFSKKITAKNEFKLSEMIKICQVVDCDLKIFID